MPGPRVLSRPDGPDSPERPCGRGETGTTKARSRLKPRQSVMAATATSFTAGWVRSTAPTSSGEMVIPPTISRSSVVHMPVAAVRLPARPVIGGQPAADQGAFRLLGPVRMAVGVRAAHPEFALRAVLHRHTGAVAQFHLETGDRAANRARVVVLEAVGAGRVTGLGGADLLQDRRAQ